MPDHDSPYYAGLIGSMSLLKTDQRAVNGPPLRDYMEIAKVLSRETLDQLLSSGGPAHLSSPS